MPTKRQNRWYGLDGQSQSRAKSFEQGSGTRKIISLVVLLALVIILIQKVSDSKQVEKVGEAIGLFEQNQQIDAILASESLDEATSLGESGSSVEPETQWLFEQLQLRSTSETQSKMQQILEHLFSVASPKETATLAELLFSQSESGTLAPIEDWRTSSLELLASWEETLANSATNGSRVELETIVSISKRLQDLTPALKGASLLMATDDEWSKALRLALDRRLILQMRDNENWREAEHLISMRTWQRVTQLNEAFAKGTLSLREIPRVEVMQMVSTSNNSVRGVPVRFRGTIALVDERRGHVESKGWPTVDYRVLWLKPEEANSQPVTVYVPDQLWKEANVDKPNQLVEVVGFFTKKVSYASQRGPETAPVIFAASLHDAATVHDPNSSIRFARWLRRLPTSKQWQPPQDLNSPFSLVSKTVAQAVGEFAADDWTSDEDSISEGILQLLLASAKHAPEIGQLCETDYPWPVASNVKLMQVSGRVTQVEKIDVKELLQKKKSLALQAMQRAEQSHIYRLTVDSIGSAKPNEPSVANQQHETVVYCNRVPKDWIANGAKESFLQPFMAAGFSCEETLEAKTRRTHVVDDVRWKIDENLLVASANQVWKPALPKHLQYLLELGWDLSFREELITLQSPVRPLVATEREPLFTLIRLVSSIEKENDDTTLKPTATLPRLLESTLAKGAKGKSKPSMEWISGSARVIRATKIPVEKSREQTWLGSNHYYELDCMADIGNVTLEMPTDKDPIIYNGEYPITLLVRELPKWLEEADRPTRLGESGNDDLQVQYPRMRVNFSGWFYRFWSYKTQEMTQSLGSQHRQMAPLVVSQSLRIGAESSSEEAKPSGSISNLSWLIGLAGVGAIWWALRGQLKKPKRRISMREQKLDKT